MTLRATIVAALPEARRIANFLERDFFDNGVAISLEERGETWVVEAYFESGEPGETEALVRDRLGSDVFGASLTVEQLPDADWVALSLEGLKPVYAGRFAVHGAHDRARISPGRINIEIEAGLAFGTAHHGTTAGCLMALDQLCRSGSFRNPLDLGTGTGVLAIALAKLLRCPVLATDIDPVAVRVARQNAENNRSARLVRVILASGMDHPEIRARAPFDLIVANILAEPLMRLAPKVAAALDRGGVLVLSGLLRNQRERVVAAYGAQGLRLERAAVREGWAVLILRRG